LLVPQTPFTAGADLFALQVTVAPPALPAQVHVQGPDPFTEDAVPMSQRFVVGFEGIAVPFAEPQSPFINPPGLGQVL
jgi:hypothetical protein